MERSVILKNTVTGKDLTMPVTPESYPVAAGRAVERLDMAQTGQVALPGLKTLFNEVLEVMFPAQLYPFCTAGAVADPNYYLELLTEWSNAGNVCRYIVVGAGVNYPVLIGPIEHEERDGSNDVYCKIPLYEYRYLDNSRPTESSNQLVSAGEYTVVKGDSLWSISKKFYGNGSLINKLAAANSIQNPSLIYPGQVLMLPKLDGLSAAGAEPLVTKPTVETADEARSVLRDTLGLGPVKLKVSF